MPLHSSLERFILVLNTVGLLGYSCWLVFRANAIFYTQEGVLYLLPALPFFFVYAYILGNRPPDEEEEIEDGKGG